jgi:hypothetical protein
MRIISYVLYGKNKLYNNGAYINSLMAKEHYPDFKVWIYISHPDDIDNNIYIKLCALDNVKIINMNNKINIAKMLWRYIPIFNETDLEIIIVRDLDSELNNPRDLFSVRKWIESDCKYHIVRDNDLHSKIHIMGGVFGAKGNNLCKYKEIFNKFLNDCEQTESYKNDIMSESGFSSFFGKDRNAYGLDQTFLKLFLYEKIIGESLIHFSEDSINNYPNKKFKQIDTDKSKNFQIIPNTIGDTYIGTKNNFGEICL